MDELEDRVWKQIEPAIRRAAARQRVRRRLTIAVFIGSVLLAIGSGVRYTLPSEPQEWQAGNSDLHLHLHRAQIALTEWEHSTAPLDADDRHEAWRLWQANEQLLRLSAPAPAKDRQALRHLGQVLHQISTSQLGDPDTLRSIVFELRVAEARSEPARPSL